MKKLAALLLLLPTLAFAGRDTNGNYTLPNGTYPVAGNTPIYASWANSIMSDIQSALSASLCRNSNCGGMNASFQLFAGSAGSPGLSFTTDQNSGLYLAGVGEHRYSILGADVLKITASGLYGMNGGSSYRIANWFDIALFQPGVMYASQVIARLPFTSSARLLSGLPSAVTLAGTTATAQSDILIKKRTAAGSTTQIGYLRFAAGSSAATISFAGDIDFAAGDFIELVGPASSDATLADVSISIQGRRL